MLVQTFRVRFHACFYYYNSASDIQRLSWAICWIGNLAMQIRGYSIYFNMRHTLHSQRAFLLRIAFTIA